MTLFLLTEVGGELSEGSAMSAGWWLEMFFGVQSNDLGNMLAWQDSTSVLLKASFRSKRWVF